MRKRYQNKRRACALCKPHKRGWDRRWAPKQLALVELAERDMRALCSRSS